MTGVPDPGRVLAGVPGWEHARYSRLGAGSNNVVYLLERNGERAILKLASSPRGFPLNTRADEARVQQMAQADGLAPRILYVDDTLLIEEFVGLPAPTAEDLRDPAVLRRIAPALRSLHALPPTGRAFPLLAAARHYRDAVRPGADLARADRCLAVIEAGAATEPRRAPRCCHNDLVTGNILLGDRACFLDWEYAADNDPLFDLATLLTHHGVDRAGTNALLDAYFGARADEHAAGLQRMCEVTAALTWLWAAARP